MRDQANIYASPIFGIYPKHISGDVIIPVDDATRAGSPSVKAQATVTIYVTQGRNRSPSISFAAPENDLGLLAQRAAEVALRQINPIILAVYLYQKDHREAGKVAQILEEIKQRPFESRSHKRSALILWSVVLKDQKRYEEAVAICQKLIELDPKDALAYNNWGLLLYYQKKYKEAAAKYQKAIELDPKFAGTYLNWGLLLVDQKEYAESAAKYQKAIDLDPKYEDAYVNWGNVLHDQKRYEEAVAKYQKAIDLDPKDAVAYLNWGNALREQKKYGEAAAKYQKAIELDPKYALAYYNWSLMLYDLKRYQDAEEKFATYRELQSSQ